MDYGILIEPQIGGTYEDQLRLARWCEANDVKVFGRADHYLWGTQSLHTTDAFAAVAGLARDTTSAELAVMVTPITFRHPGVIAKMAATIDEMSGGRFILGVGTGWMQEEHDAFGFELWPMQERFERLEEALRFLRAAFSPGANGFEGTHYRLDEVEVLPVPANLRIMIGGGGPRKTPTLAGRYGDEYNQFVDPPEKLAPRFDVFREAATAAGRNPDDIVISVVFQSVMGGDEAAYRRRLEADAAFRDISADDYAARLAGRGMPHGAPEQVQEAVSRLADLGVGRLYIQLVNPLAEVDLERLEESFAIVRG